MGNYPLLLKQSLKMIDLVDENVNKKSKNNIKHCYTSEDSYPFSVIEKYFALKV
jgi:hypothetical protein